MGIIEVVPFVILIAGAALVGLWWSNFFLDHGIKHWQSRKVGHFFGGTACLLAVFLLESWIIATILAGLFTLMLFVARYVRGETFRGVGGSARPGVAAEVWFPLSIVIVWTVGWGIFNRPIEATCCLLFMAWGDCLTGWVRALRYDTPTKGVWGSVAMLTVCLVLAWAFIKPVGVGACAAIVATGVEWCCGDVSKIRFLHWADDNFFIPLCSAATVFGLLALIGQL